MNEVDRMPVKSHGRRRSALIGGAVTLAVIGAIALSHRGQLPASPTAGSGTPSTASASSIKAAASTTGAVSKAAAAAAIAAAPTRTLALGVQASRDSLASDGPRSGTAVTSYKWLIQQDNTGDSQGGQDSPSCHPALTLDLANQGVQNNTTFPQGCPWPSIQNMASAPMVSTGSETDWGSATLPSCNCTQYDATHPRGLKDGKYLVSVLADGYELGGAHFTVPFAADDHTADHTGTIRVKLNPFPIPLGTVRLRVCADETPVSGTCDLDTEKGLQGFRGTLYDYDALVSVDYYGNPMCTQYKTDANGLIRLSDGSSNGDNKDVKKGHPIPVPNTGGQCLSDAKGDIVIPNMPPNHYSARVTAPQGQTWIQTTTLEGNHDFDVWTMANDTGYDTELVVGGEPVPFIHFGFVHPAGTQPKSTLTAGSTPGYLSDGIGSVGSPATGAIKGQVFGASAYLPGLGGLPGLGNSAGVSGQKLQNPVPGAWVGLNSLANNDHIIYGGPAQANTGTFTINNVPDGDYALAVWDYNQNYLLDTFNVTVTGGKLVDLGILPLNNWWTRISGKVCVDQNNNGRCDPGEPGISKIFVQNLMRGNHAVDGGVNTAFTDLQGSYSLSEGYPLGQFVVQQVYNQRYKTSGITYQACNDKQEHTVVTPAVDISYLAVFGLCARIDWALKPYSPGSAIQNGSTDNGGIVATVLNDTLRVTNPARQNIQFDHFVGVPGVQVDMYQPIPDTATYTTPGVDAAGNPTTSFADVHSAADSAAKWVPNQWQGYTVVSGRTQGTVFSNTATTLTLSGAGWTAGAPVSGSGFTIKDKGYKLCTTYNGCAANDGSYAVQSGPTAPLVSIDSVMPGSLTQPLPPGGVPSGTANDSTKPSQAINYTTPAQSYVSEHYGPPTGCVPMDANGVPLPPQAQNVAAVPGATPGAGQTTNAYQNGAAPCIEAALTGVGIGGGTDNNPVFYTDSTGAIVPADIAAPLDDPSHPFVDPTSPTGATYVIGGTHGIQTVDGNYGITPPKPGDVLVHIEIPGDKVLARTADANGNLVDRPLLHVSSELDRNDSHGMLFVPQGSDITPANLEWNNPAEPANQQPTGTNPENPGTGSPAPDPQCAGPAFVVKVTDGHFLADGGSPFEGQTRNLCDTKLIHVEAGQSVAPNFHTWTDVPVATKFSGLILDDKSLATSHQSAGMGDVNPIGGAPIGVYDWAGNQLYTTTSDYNGVWSMLMPSTAVSNCPTPAGVCPTVYRFVGNDPGQPSSPNYNYNPQYRTIAANFQAWPGQLVPADVAPTIQAYSGSVAPGQNFTTPAAQLCLPQYVNPNDPALAAKAASNVPQLFSVDKPYTTKPGSTDDTVTITGLGLGVSAGKVTLTDSAGNSQALATPTWTDRSVVATVPGSLGGGAYQLDITSSTSVAARNGITYHILRGSYTPKLLLVNPPASAVPPTSGSGAYVTSQYPAIQAALEDAAKKGNSVVVVFPNEGAPVTIPTYNSTGTPVYSGPVVTDTAAQWLTNEWSGYAIVAGNHAATVLSNTTDSVRITAAGWSNGTPANGTAFTIHQIQTPSNFTPLTAYYENVVIHSAVKLQGTGPGGIYPPDPVSGQSTAVTGSVVDGRYFFSGEVPAGPGGATGTVQTNWDNLIASLNINGPAAVPDAAVITAVATRGHAYSAGFPPSVDGLRIQGGDDNATSGNNTTVAFQKVAATTTPFATQGGAIYLHAHDDNFRITNNLVATDSGVYGDIRIGAPQGTPTNFPGPNSQPNHDVTIAHNAIIATGGTNLAGALGIFTGSDRYTVDSNFFCGNHSSEYGGAIGHYGLSPKGRITNNTFALNESIDEGGAILIAGENPPPGKLSPGAGTVDISHNYMTGNLAGDDGGAIRFLSAGLAKFTVADNVITNNVSAHEGGGISIDDAPNVTIVNNTVAKNVTTATAPTSDGTPAPAGISTGRNSVLLDKASGNCPSVNQNPPVDCVSKPTIVNDILWDNRAGSWSPDKGILGIGLGGNADVLLWDVGTADNSGLLAPHSSLLGTPETGPQGYTHDATNIVGDARPGGPLTNDPFNADDPTGLLGPFTTRITVTAQRSFFRFRPTAVVTADLPANLIGNYELKPNSPAMQAGVHTSGQTTAPGTNVDNQEWKPGGANRPNMGAK